MSEEELKVRSDQSKGEACDDEDEREDERILE